jgi:uncharacterized membrane protein
MINVGVNPRTANGGDVDASVQWEASDGPGQTGAGRFSDPNAPFTSFICTAIGQVTLTVTISCGARVTMIADCEAIVFPPGDPTCLQLTSLTEPPSLGVGNTTTLEAGVSDPGVPVTWTLSDPTLASLGHATGLSTTLTCNGVGIETVTATAGPPSCDDAGCPFRTVSFDLQCCGLSIFSTGTVAEDSSSVTLLTEFASADVVATWTLSDPSLGRLSKTSGEVTTFTCGAFGTETVTLTGRLPGGGDATCSTQAFSFQKSCDVLPDGTVRPGLCPVGDIPAGATRQVPVGFTASITATALLPDGRPFPGATAAWTTSAASDPTGVGRLGNQSALEATFTCDKAGAVTISAAVGATGDPACDSTADLSIVCCPQVAGLSATASPATVAIGSSTTIQATGFTNFLTASWNEENFAGQTGSGAIGIPAFTCLTAGQVTLTITEPSDSPCAPSASVVITCVDPVDDESQRPAACRRPAPGGPATVFQSMGTIPGTGVFIVPYAVSADGKTAVGEANASFQRRAFRWTAAEGYVLMDGDNASGVNADGSVIVGTQNPGRTLATRWNAGAIDHFGLPTGLSGVARDVSDDGGSVVGFADYGADLGGFLWTSSSGLQLLPGVNRQAFRPTAISRDGVTVVGNAASGGGSYVGVKWRAQTGAVLLAGPTASDASYDVEPLDVTVDGSVIGTLQRVLADGTPISHAVKWTPDNRIVNLSPSGLDGAQLYAMNADGSVILSNFGIWDVAHGLRDLGTVIQDAGGVIDGWELNFAYGITPDGKTIVGTGVCGEETLGWIARLP